MLDKHPIFGDALIATLLRPAQWVAACTFVLDHAISLFLQASFTVLIGISAIDTNRAGGITRIQQPLEVPPVMHVRAADIVYAHAAELAAPQVVRGLTEAMPMAEILDRHAGLGFAQEVNDLFFGT
ncbi:hypothetical protein IXO99_07370, partial [Xanthomonas oryzae pv. oryzae]